MENYHPRLNLDRDIFVFDLDNTLYHHEAALFPQVERRIGEYVQQTLGLEPDAAYRQQKKLFMEHGTTLNGLMITAKIDPKHFLDFVHDIDFSALQPDPRLREALLTLGGRRIIYTNADQPYSEKVLERLGIADLFEDLFDILAADLEPKPATTPYRTMLSRFSIDPHRAIMFEDMARNLKPASELGMGGVWINTGSEWGAAGHHDDHVHEEIPQLAPWLESYAEARATALESKR